MLTARQTGTSKKIYEISADERPLVEWDANTWSVGGSFALEDRQYEARAICGQRATK